ncbi:MAG: GNAT family N-acetyltransferase [Promethearchaeota archaeon]
MFTKIPPEESEKYKHLFRNWKYFSVTLKYALEEKIGQLEVDDPINPVYAKFSFATFLYLAGTHDKKIAHKILETLPSRTIIIVNDQNWFESIERFYGSKEGIDFRYVERTNFSNASLSLEHLQSLKKPLPEGFDLEKVDKKTAENLPFILKGNILAYFGTADNFIERGVGFCVKEGDKPVSMASSGFPFKNSLEIDIVTVDDPKYRRKGLATAASIALIEHCMEKGISAHWDAQNEPSIRLATKLGFTSPEKWKLFYFWKKT